MTLPSDISPDRVIRALTRAGFRIEEGSKHTLAVKGTYRTTIPRHRRVLPGTLREILKQAGLTPEQFLEFL